MTSKHDSKGHEWLKKIQSEPPVLLTEYEMFQLCQSVMSLLTKENNVIHVQSPVTVCGDIHGQFHDLIHLFELGRPIPKSRYIFLGDYVDRGCKSLEVIQYLLILKLCYPDNIFLLRGNHESRQITQVYGFYDECLMKYGNATVWTYCTDIFDCMALGVIIEGQVFGVHGGLSPNISFLDQVQILDRFQEIPSGSPIEDLTWSDPEDFNGWAVNTRGAGWLFGRDVVAEFSHLNDLDLIVRAHQLTMEGYKYMFPPENSLVTIWSASNYCYRCGNIAAILQFDQNMKRNIKTFEEKVQFAESFSQNQDQNFYNTPSYYI